MRKSFMKIATATHEFHKVKVASTKEASKSKHLNAALYGAVDNDQRERWNNLYQEAKKTMEHGLVFCPNFFEWKVIPDTESIFHVNSKGTEHACSKEDPDGDCHEWAMRAKRIADRIKKKKKKPTLV